MYNIKEFLQACETNILQTGGNIEFIQKEYNRQRGIPADLLLDCGYCSEFKKELEKGLMIHKMDINILKRLHEMFQELGLIVKLNQLESYANQEPEEFQYVELKNLTNQQSGLRQILVRIVSKPNVSMDAIYMILKVRDKSAQRSMSVFKDRVGQAQFQIIQQLQPQSLYRFSHFTVNFYRGEWEIKLDPDTKIELIEEWTPDRFQELELQNDDLVKICGVVYEVYQKKISIVYNNKQYDVYFWDRQCTNIQTGAFIVIENATYKFYNQKQTFNVNPRSIVYNNELPHAYQNCFIEQIAIRIETIPINVPFTIVGRYQDEKLQYSVEEQPVFVQISKDKNNTLVKLQYVLVSEDRKSLIITNNTQISSFKDETSPFYQKLVNLLDRQSMVIPNPNKSLIKKQDDNNFNKEQTLIRDIADLQDTICEKTISFLVIKRCDNNYQQSSEEFLIEDSSGTAYLRVWGNQFTVFPGDSLKMRNFRIKNPKSFHTINKTELTKELQHRVTQRKKLADGLAQANRFFQCRVYLTHVDKPIPLYFCNQHPLSKVDNLVCTKHQHREENPRLSHLVTGVISDASCSTEVILGDDVPLSEDDVLSEFMCTIQRFLSNKNEVKLKIIKAMPLNLLQEIEYQLETLL